MRTLKFIVEGQTIRQDPECDFSNLVPGTENYMKAEFSFSNEWQGCMKVIGFYSIMGKEYKPEVIKDGSSCIIPAEALKKRAFKLRVGGVRPNGTKIITDKITISQDGGNL